MPEQAPQPISQPDNRRSVLIPPQESDQHPVGPALQAFRDFCQENEFYAKVTPELQARLRPKLLHEFIQQAVKRTSQKRGMPQLRPFFDRDTIRRDIDSFQTRFGATPQTDTIRNVKRRHSLDKYQAISDVFIDIPDIQGAFWLLEQATEANDQDIVDSTRTLLAVFGETLERRHPYEVARRRDILDNGVLY